MLQFARRLRVARLLVLLTVLLAVGFGQHAHAWQGGMGDRPLVSAAINGGEQGEDRGDGGAAGEAHCGFCHLSGAMPRASDGVQSPTESGVRAPSPVASSPVENVAPDLPTRPPRRVHSA